MISYSFMGNAPDMQYDYSNLLPTFKNVFNESQQWQVVQSIEQDAEGFNQILTILSSEAHNSKIEYLVDEKQLALTHGLRLDLKVLLKHGLFKTLSQVEKSSNPYGILVGIRPVKLVHEQLMKGRTESEIEESLRSIYGIEAEKIDLMLRVARAEMPILLEPTDNKISLYICIPFCKTRCLYCSFPANPVKQKGHLMQRYVDALCHEIKAAAEDLASRGLEVDCLYIGGGTPTALTDEQFEQLLKTVGACFDRAKIKEYTVEAGRPDTFTEAKLAAMVSANVDRICVNPQTMNDKTLVAIGRDHSADDVVAQFNALRTVSTAAVNMDLIAGLDTETAQDMAETIAKVISLRPENVTLHTLALKRASRLNEEREKHDLQQGIEVEKMVALAYTSLREAGYEPYYMYRQKQMIGNLENIGFALPGYVGLYNVRIMEERHSILALGAGAVSKLYFPEENRLERFSNTKGLEDYLNRVDEMIEKRKAWLTSRYDFSIMK